MATSPPVRVGTRRSALAMKQAEVVVAGLRAAHPGLELEIVGMSVMGDVDKTTPLPDLGKGLWTNELEAKLMEGELDMVVHSLKDMPTTIPDGCRLGAVTARQDPRDVLVVRRAHAAAYRSITDLPAGSVVGTSSVRRMAQLRRAHPGLRYKDIRGNIDTRLKKLDAEENGYDAIILAAAGLLRMGFDGRIVQYLSSETEGGGTLHAVGQGALGIEVRQGDERTLGLLKSLEDKRTMLACVSERSVMRTLEGGCSVPIGVETRWTDDGKLRLQATVVSVDGSDAVSGDMTENVSTADEADEFGKKLAHDLVDRGAGKILEAINQSRAPPAPTVVAS